MQEVLMMAITPQLGKSAKKRPSHPSSILEPILVFRKLVNKLEQAEIIKKLRETEILKLEFENNFQTRTSQINHIHDSGNELAEKNHLNNKYLQKESKFQRKSIIRKMVQLLS